MKARAPVDLPAPLPPRLTCICGTHRAPQPWRRTSKAHLYALRCPVCHFMGDSTVKPEQLREFWNRAVIRRDAEAAL
jgi:hypothetical protein